MPPNSAEPNRPGPSGDSLSRGFETSDANPDGVLGFLGGLLVTIVVVCLVAGVVFHYLRIASSESVPPSVFYGVRQLPASPQLQVNPRADLLNLEAEQQRELETYAWQDRQAGTVRIPIDRAMDLLVQRMYAPAGKQASANTRQTPGKAAK